MKCEECATNALEEFLDGELDERRATGMSAHLASCRSCAAAYEALLDEQAMYASYERDLEVTPQIWNGIAARIVADEKPRMRTSLSQKIRAWLAPALTAPRFSPVLTAAMMIVAVGATAAVMKFMNSQKSAQPPAVAAVPPATTPQYNNAVQPSPEVNPTAEPTMTENNDPVVAAHDKRRESDKPQTSTTQRKREAERKLPLPSNDAMRIETANLNSEAVKRQRMTEKLVREAESKYLAAIKMLSEDVNRRRTTLDPQVAARFDETLAAIDRTIAETRRTVASHGNDPIAVQYMLSAYAKKVEVMREMATLD